MRHFKEYLVESEKTYNYRIKVCGETPSGFFKDLKNRLSQFEVVKMSDAKNTPVMALPTDFPDFKNERVSMVDVEFRYPAIEPQIKQLAQLTGLDPNRIVMHTEEYTESMGQEYAEIDKNDGLLTDTNLPAPSREQKALSKDYAADPHDHEVLKNSYRSKFSIAGGKTPAAETTNDLPMGNKSAISGTNRVPAVKSNAR